MSHSQDKYLSTRHLEKDLRGKAVRGAGAVTFARSSIYVLRLGGTAVLARLLSPGDFGLVAMVTIIANILVEFGLLRFTEAMIQRETITHEQASALFWINVVLCLILALVMAALAPAVSWFYGQPRLTPVTIVFAAGFLFSGLSAQHVALLQRTMQFGKIAARDIVSTVLADISAIVMALTGMGYWALVARNVLFTLFVAIGSWLLCGWRPGRPVWDSTVWSMVKFGVNSLGGYTTGYVTRSLDKVLIGRRWGAGLLGFYDRAYHLFVMPVNQLSYPLTGVAVATLSRLRDDAEKFRSYYLKAVSKLAFIGMAVSALLTLAGRDIIRLLLGPKWGMTGEVFMIFGPAIGIMLVSGTYGWLHFSLGRADRYFRWGIVAMTSTAVFFIIGLPFGIKGVAAAYSLSFYVLFGPGFWYAGRPIRLGPSAIISAIWKYFLAAAAAGGLCWAAENSFVSTSEVFHNLNIFARLSVTGGSFIFLYLTLVVLLHGSLDPVTQFISVISEMLPKALREKKAA